MKIVFNRDLSRRKIKYGKGYNVIQKTGDSYLILNDDGYPASVVAFNGEINITDGESLLNGAFKIDGQISEIESEVSPLLTEAFKSIYSSYVNDLFEHRCWAVTEFSNKLLSEGIEICEEFRQIAISDLSKMTYVQAEMNALFLSVCNFFSNCSDEQFRFRFDKHSKENIDLLALANISLNNFYDAKKDVESLVEIEDWRETHKEELYSTLTVHSDFGKHIKKHGLMGEGDEEEMEELCLRRSITRITNAIDSIFYDSPVRVHQVPVVGFADSSWGEYCLIFETKDIYYRFYLGYFD